MANYGEVVGNRRAIDHNSFLFWLMFDNCLLIDGWQLMFAAKFLTKLDAQFPSMGKQLVPTQIAAYPRIQCGTPWL